MKKTMLLIIVLIISVGCSSSKKYEGENFVSTCGLSSDEDGMKKSVKKVCLPVRPYSEDLKSFRTEPYELRKMPNMDDAMNYVD